MCSLRDEDCGLGWGAGAGGRKALWIEGLDRESQSPTHLSPAGGLWASVSPPVTGTRLSVGQTTQHAAVHDSHSLAQPARTVPLPGAQLCAPASDLKPRRDPVTRG